MKIQFTLFLLFILNCVFGQSVSCYTTALKISRPDYPSADTLGPYYPGENVNFCLTIEFLAYTPGTGHECQWIQGIIPTFSSAWDIQESNINLQGPSGSFWLVDSMVQYNVFNSIANTFLQSNGELGLKVGGTSPLQPGTYLPAGWWFTSNGGTLCENDGDPDTMWGLPSGCGIKQTVNFCLNLKVKDAKELQNCEFQDLNFNVFVFADGETGCWQNAYCINPLPLQFIGAIDCRSSVSVFGLDKEICSENEVHIEAIASLSGLNIKLSTIDNPNVIGETLNGLFPNSIVSFSDLLINIGSNIEEVTYVFEAEGPNGEMLNAIPFELKVKVYPNLMVSLPSYSICTGDCVELKPTISNNSGLFLTYLWNNNLNTFSIKACPDSNSTYSLKITNSIGCEYLASTDLNILKGKNNFINLPDSIKIYSGDVLTINNVTIKPANLIIAKSSLNAAIKGQTILDTFYNSSIAIRDSLTIIGSDSIQEFDYTFEIFDDLIGCWSDPISKHITVFKKKAVQTVDSKISFIKIYENPTKGDFRISGISNEIDIEFYNLEGRLLKTLEKVNESAIISIQEFKNGVYILKLKGQLDSEYVKIFKIE